MRARVGVGALAEVYAAWQRSGARRVALKVVRDDRLADRTAADVLQRALLEQGRRMQSLAGSDGLVTVHAVGVDPDTGVAFIAMELLEGRDLLEQMRLGGPLDAVEAVAFGAAAAATLARFHERGFVHGDVKPSNLFLHAPGADRPVLKVLDPTPGGRGDDGGAPTTATTPLYTAPEFLSRGELGPAYDVYSLGLTIYELVTGTAPMLRETAQISDIYRNQLELELPPLVSGVAKVPREVSAIVDRMTSKAPELRYKDARAVAAVLGECLSRLRAGPAKLSPRARALELATPNVAPPSSREGAERPEYGYVAQVATVAFGRPVQLAPSLDGVDEAALARLRRVEPTPPLGLDVVAVVAGPTRVLGLRYPLAVGVWRAGRALTCDLCVPHKSVELEQVEVEVSNERVVVRALGGPGKRVQIDGESVFEGVVARGSRLALGNVVLERFAAGAELPPEEVAQVPLPAHVLARGARFPSFVQRIDMTHRMFLARSPSPSEPMRRVATEQRTQAERALAMWTYAMEMMLRKPEVPVAQLAELLALVHEEETQLRILDGDPLERILQERLAPFIDWAEVARARIASRSR